MATAEWKSAKLDELGFVGRGRSGHRPRNAAFLYGGRYPFFQTGDIKAADFHLTEYTQTYSEEGLAQSRLWKPGTLCITIAANIAETAILGIEGCFPDSVVGFVADPDKADVRFIKYYMDTLKLQMQGVSRGTTQDNLSLDKLLTFDFLVPPLPVQRRIAGILSAYDDVIENNTRRIKILEEMAQAIYREWFVNFCFPGHETTKLVDSEAGQIPAGWTAVTVTGAVDVDPPTKVPREGIKPFVPMGSLSNNSMVISNVEEREGNSGSKFRNGDTLFARITPCLENGKTGFVKFLPDENAVAFGSTEFIVLRSHTVTPEYVYLMARSDSFRGNAIKSMSGATGRQRVQNACFDKYMIAQPPASLLQRFTDTVRPMFELVSALAQRNANLRQTRDLLLPELISGRVPLKTEGDHAAND